MLFDTLVRMETEVTYEIVGFDSIKKNILDIISSIRVDLNLAARKITALSEQDKPSDIKVLVKICIMNLSMSKINKGLTL